MNEGNCEVRGHRVYPDVKECLEVTRTWACLTPQQAAGRGPQTLMGVVSWLLKELK